MKNKYLFMFSFLILSLLFNLIFVGYSIELKSDLLRLNIEMELNESINIRINDVNDFMIRQNNLLNGLLEDDIFAEFLKLDSSDFEYNETLDKVYDTIDSSVVPYVGVVNPEGIVLASKRREAVGYDISLSSAFQNLGSVYAVYPDMAPEKVLFGLGEAVVDNDSGEVLGVVGIRVDMDELRKIVAGHDFGELEELYLVNDELLLLTTSRLLREENQGVLIQVVDTENARRCFSMFESGMFEEYKNHSSFDLFLDYRGIEVFGTYKKISGAEWCLLNEVDRGEVFDAPLKDFTWNKIIIGFIIVVLFGLIGFFVGSYFDGKNGKRSLEKIKNKKFENKFLSKVKLWQSILFAFVFIIGYFFLVTSFFQGWANAAWYDEISDLATTFVLILLFFYGFKLRKNSSRIFIVAGSLLAIIDKLIQIILEEYISSYGIISAFFWIPGAIIGFIGLFLIFFGLVEVME
jgi:hypothetical protein